MDDLQFYILLNSISVISGLFMFAQSVAHLTQEPEFLGLIPSQATSISHSADSRRAVVSYWQKYVHLVLVNLLRGLSLHGKSMVRLTDHPNMTIAVYHGHKNNSTTIVYVCSTTYDLTSFYR